MLSQIMSWINDVVGANSLVVSAPTYSATAHGDPSSIPVSRSFADPAPPLSPHNAFLSALYCPVPIKAEYAHKYNFKKNE